MSNTDIAWLAGIWDGEGSVGVTKQGRRDNVNQVWRVQAQIQMTHEPTVRRTVEILNDLGLTATVYRWLEKKAHHKDAYGYGVTRTGYVLTMAEALLPYAVTKQEHWAATAELCRLRIDRQGLGKDGQLRRGGPEGKWWKPYSERELELIDQLAALSRRGKPAGLSSAVVAPRGPVQESLESQRPGSA
ncbi:LAGLIDADG family homing endonuclease [Streptomyces clavifer]|uniref:LAGLIDADG family homing endonuclease n=1 Tax=Streptomyces clavifer TaxID=68188 RepID=UPI0033ED87EA